MNTPYMYRKTLVVGNIFHQINFSKTYDLSNENKILEAIKKHKFMKYYFDLDDKFKNKEIYFYEIYCMDLIKHTLNEEENN